MPYRVETCRPTLRGVVLFLAFALALGTSAVCAAAQTAPNLSYPPAPTVSWTIRDAVTTISLDRTTLAALGLETSTVKASTAQRTPHRLSVVPEGAPSFAAQGQIGLRGAVGADGFHSFEGGALHLGGGFQLRGSSKTFDLSSLELRPGQKAGSLELVDAGGRALFTTADAQWVFDADTGELRYLNADVRILPSLAQFLGHESYANMTVGVLDLDADFEIGATPPAPEPLSAPAPPPCGDFSGSVDVSLGDMSSISQAGIATVNGRSVVVVLPSADLRNVGSANVPWYSKFTHLSTAPFDQHPFLVWQMTRISGGVIEPLGRSDLKHAFLTLNTGCSPGACTDSQILGIGCGDVYGTSTNNSTGSLAPRAEVSASTGLWAHCGGISTHFDTNGDCSQDFSGSGENAFTHGLKAAESDLQVAGSSYFVEAFYIIRNDINIFNSMGYRQVAPTKPGSVWSFPLVGAYNQGPPINAWVNPTTPGAGNDNRVLDTGEGHVQVAVRVFDIAGSNPPRKRYAYALQNHDFDRRIKSFFVPFDNTFGVVENPVYKDGDGFAANDWTATIDPTGVTWTAPAATTPPAEIDYATLVSFRFDSDREPAAAQSKLGVFEAGSPTELQVETLAPAPPGVTPVEGYFFSLTPCRLLDTRSQGGAIVSGNERVLDVVGVTACGVPANATAVAINVTAIGASSGGEVAVYSGANPSPLGTVTFRAGATRANNAVCTLTQDGHLTIRPSLNAGGSTHVVLDVVGYFAPSP